MAVIAQMTDSNAFLWMKMYEFWLRFHWTLFSPVQLTIFQHFRWQAIIWTNDSLLTHLCVTWPQWVNTSNFITMTTLQTMCLTKQYVVVLSPTMSVYVWLYVWWGHKYPDHCYASAAWLSQLFSLHMICIVYTEICLPIEGHSVTGQLIPPWQCIR